MMTVLREGYVEIRGSAQTLEDLNPTTRCYPRTLEEAFPNTVERAEWFYPPEKRELDVVQLLMWATTISMWIGLGYLLFSNL